jgi:hypothetical protein
MTQSNSTTQSSSGCDSSFPSGSVTLVLDAPRQQLTTPPLPINFRTMQDIPDISGTLASGSAEFSAQQFQAILTKIGQNNGAGFPLVVVDLRQESHGFLDLQQPLNGETEIAVGWFAERDWINVAKGLASIVVDEEGRLAGASQTANLSVYDVLTKTPDEDGICTATKHPVQPTGTYKTEHTLVTNFANVSYLRLPSTDHCRPRDHEVDQFVAFEAALDAETWLHFHCRAGDGRTTTFMAMHDIIHNAPGDSLQTILARQKSIGGIDLASLPTNEANFSYPFSIERVDFIQNFYLYVCAARPDGFKVTWSDWVDGKFRPRQSSAFA